MKPRRPRRKLCLPCNHPIHPPGHCDKILTEVISATIGRGRFCPCSGPNSQTMTPEAALAHLNRKATARQNNAAANSWQRRMVDLGQAHGYLVHHQRPGLTKSGHYASQIMGDRGFLDTVFVDRCERQPGSRGAFIVEAKTGNAVLSPEEREWHDALKFAGWEVYVLYPKDEPFLVARLQSRGVLQSPPVNS